MKGFDPLQMLTIVNINLIKLKHLFLTNYLNEIDKKTF